MRLLRLRGRKVCDRVLRKGNVWKGSMIIIRWLPGPPRHPAVDPKASGLYVGTLVSGKLEKSAVKRNRMRRRCREALRVTVRGHDTLPTVQLLILPRSSSLSADFKDIRKDVLQFLSVLQSCPRTPGASSNSR